MPRKTTKTPLPAGVESLDDVARRYVSQQSGDVERRDYSQKEREAMDKSDFADPENLAFPIKVPKDVVHAAERLHNASGDQAAIKRRIIAIARRKGFPLPDTWQAEEAAKATKRADQPDEHEDGRTADELVDDITAGDGSDVEDESKEADGDDDLQPEAADDRSEPEATIVRSDLPAPDVSYYAPITRIDKESREIIGVATAEVKDAYRTVIGYEASKDAFARWRGNIREMHQSKAVGRALEITPDDDHRRIIVRARISKGAEDTWQKILDGTLTGFSIGGKNGVWTTRTIDGEDLPYLERYDQAELSVVDNPACPAATIEVVRADGIASDVLAKDEEMDLKSPEKVSPPEASVERAGARLSKETMDALHTARDHSLNAAKQTMQTCGCDDCMATMNQLAEHDDGDGDMDMRKVIADIVRAEIAEVLRAQLSPSMQRINALLASDAQRSESPEITRRVDGIDEQLSSIKELVEKIAAQPVDGGPVLHGAAVDKRLATQNSGNASRATDADAIQRAMELGFAPPSDPNEAIRAAARLVRPIPR